MRSSRQGGATAKGGHRFTETLQTIDERAAKGPVTLGELFHIAGPQGHGFVAMFLVLPFLQPIPLPGISTAIGIVLTILGAFVALRKPPWLPSRLERLRVEPEIILRVSHTVERLMHQIEHVVKPRAQWLFSARWFCMTNGVVWIVHALVFSLPLPIPFSNALPAIVILLLALGHLEEDFGVVVAAYVAAIANLLFFGGLIAIPALGWQVLSS